MEKLKLDKHRIIDQEDFLYLPDFLQESIKFIPEIEKYLEFEYHNIKIFGKEIKEPRSTSFLSTEPMEYTYSGIARAGLPYPDIIQKIQDQIEKKTKCQFNSCLINSYKNGDEYMGWHKDNEPELGKNPNVACISLGAERDFQFRSSEKQFEINLKSGSLFLMRNSFQTKYKHQIPKRLKVKEKRLSLTYRLLKI